MSLERKHRPGGHFRSVKRFNQYREAASRAQEEIKIFKIGEPSEAFYPLAEHDNIIYLADRPKNPQQSQGLEKESIATTQDIENRKREQLERYVWQEHVAGHRGNLTMAWRRFGLRHKDEIKELKGEARA